MERIVGPQRSQSQDGEHLYQKLESSLAVFCATNSCSWSTLMLFFIRRLRKQSRYPAWFYLCALQPKNGEWPVDVKFKKVNNLWFLKHQSSLWCSRTWIIFHNWRPVFIVSRVSLNVLSFSPQLEHFPVRQCALIDRESGTNSTFLQDWWRCHPNLAADFKETKWCESSQPNNHLSLSPLQPRIDWSIPVRNSSTIWHVFLRPVHLVPARDLPNLWPRFYICYRPYFALYFTMLLSESIYSN